MKRTALLLVVLLGCAQDGEDGDSVEVEQLASGSVCPSGGVRLSAGKDSQVVCNGERGASGAQGQSGQAAEQGAALVPETITACNSLATLPASGVLASLGYQLVTFSDGSVFVSCEAQTTPLVGASHAQFYAGWQQGAAVGGCIVASDGSGTPDGGWWDFTAPGGKPRATYHDMGTADDLAVHTFPASDCAVMRPN